MLSAQKDTNPASPTTARSTSPGGSAVGTVVNSIQSLRQRVNDYTLEEIADAENRSRTLILGLSNLQRRVRYLAAIKESMTAVCEAIEQARSEDYMLSICELSDKPLRLHDIVQASNLIRFPTLKKLSLQTSRRTVHNDSLMSQISPIATDTPKFVEDLIEARPAAGREATIGPTEEPSFVFDAEQMGTALPNSAANFSWDEEHASTFRKDIADEISYNEDIEVNAATSTAESINRTDFLTAPEHDQVLRAREPNPSTSTALVPSGGDFDQRLLDDLIKNYGELFSSADSRAKVESQNKIETDDPASAKILLEAPALEGAKDQTARALPLKKEGDINRQLKKIIKDYGEYDIYSRQSPINVKFAMIGAFLLVGAVFSGVYFLSSSKSHEPSSPPASAPTASTISDKDTTEKRSTEASAAKALSKSIVVKK
jgi:hypothetical protein